MAKSRNAYMLRARENGNILISEEVLSSIAAIAALEVKGVASLAGNITNELKNYIGMRKIPLGVKTTYNGEILVVDVVIKVEFGCNIYKVSKAVQEKIKTSIENMTGIEVTEVNVKIADVNMQEN